MLGRLFGRKSPADASPSEEPKPGLWDRVKTLFIGLWNWTILLAAIAGFLICLRLTYGFWATASEATDTDTVLLFGAMAAAGLAGTVFLGWQCWRGIRYLRHRQRRG